jgi:ribokinase
MGDVLVSGLINIETTLKVERFPIEYSPVRFSFYGANSSVSGVGLNVAKALATLGDQARLLSLIGRDAAGVMVREALRAAHLNGDGVLERLANTPQSVILYDERGRRQINVDLKDIQEQAYPAEQFEQALHQSSLAVLCNINFSRPFLPLARRAGKLIATDVHTIASLEDDYNQDFMAAADILFMSDEHLPLAPEELARRVLDRFGAEVVVIGLGSKGALLAARQDHILERLPAVVTRPVVNTIGAGDALFSCFVHYYAKTRDPYLSLQRAIVFASYKIGEAGAADGFLDEASLERLCLEKSSLF